MEIDSYIASLVAYGLKTELLPPEEEIYATNLILGVLKKSEYKKPAVIPQLELEEILSGLCDYACASGLLTDEGVTARDLYDTKLMNCLMPRPKQVIETFWKRYESDPKMATDYFYKLCRDGDYIRQYRIKKDIKWTVASDYGEIDITINLSKPEKDPRAIAAARLLKPSSYPKCLLCAENEGYAGHLNHPARDNHRIIPLTLDGSKWGLQYSPYVYYNEHCIVLNTAHVPMKIDRSSFRKLLDFLKLFPHYFIGSNADLPIVGGSILSHDHFQGGNYTFAMTRAKIERSFTIPGWEDVEAGIVHWPLSTIRLRCSDDQRLVDLGEHILKCWRAYTDESAFVLAETGGEMHNTITPIARMRGGQYELDLVLRNNITTEGRPLGVYHPRPEYHHIKKENIGLIEVMGLAVLPSRLKEELRMLEDCLVEGRPIRDATELEKHADWIDELQKKYTFDRVNTAEILRREIGRVFVGVLEDAGVYKCTAEGREAFMRFAGTL